MAFGSIAGARPFSGSGTVFMLVRKLRTSSAVFTSTSSSACRSFSAWIFASSSLSRGLIAFCRATSRTAISPMRIPGSASTRSVRGSKLAGSPVSSTRAWPALTGAARSTVALPGYSMTLVMRPPSWANAGVANTTATTAQQVRIFIGVTSLVSL